MDADVIKAGVHLGLGVGMIAQMAVGESPINDTRVIPGLAEFFGAGVTRIALQKGIMLRNYAYQFVAMLAPHLDAFALSRKKQSNANIAAVAPSTALNQITCDKP